MTAADFTIGGVADTMGSQLADEGDKIGDMVDKFDPDNPADEFKMQIEIAKYKAEVGLMSALVKDINDVQQQIIQKV
ncbi:MAG: hypothetical protein OXE40_09340 [Gammaproteobacteria bacterium]|nr:hypothetical protein [Gammaproteobacteria bacterium]